MITIGLVVKNVFISYYTLNNKVVLYSTNQTYGTFAYLFLWLVKLLKLMEKIKLKVVYLGSKQRRFV